MFANLKIGARLYGLIGAFALAMTTFGGLAFYTLSQVEVGGPIYGEIVEGKDLVADILPPPAYLIETYYHIVDLETQVVAGAPITAMQEHIDALSRLEDEYAARIVFWEANLADENGLRQAMLEDARLPAEQLFAVTQAEFIPAVLAGDAEEAIRIRHEQIEPLYVEHRAAVDDVVVRTNERNAQIEAQTQNQILTMTVAM
ncbi:MAG TPA: hypothetical protein PK954_26220, partial [Anaerolineales bacterium]|nr:hypothetical protein [Anaerolineales bacterium]